MSQRSNRHVATASRAARARVAASAQAGGTTARAASGGQLTVHLPCARVRGWTGYGRQGCPCAPAPKWEGCDVSRLVDLCAVCGRGTAGGISRWAWLACDHCRDVEKALQAWLGIRVLPLGRHSIMNGVGLRVAEAADEEVDAFCVQFEDLSLGWDRLSAWGKAEVGRLAESLPDAGPDVPLPLWQRRFRPSWRHSVDAYERLLGTSLPPALRQAERSAPRGLGRPR